MRDLRVRERTIGRVALGLLTIIMALSGGSPTATGGLGAALTGPGASAGGIVRTAATVESDAEPAAPSSKLAPAGSVDDLPLWSSDDPDAEPFDLKALLVAAGFDDVVLFSEEEMKALGKSFTAGWISPSGKLFGMLYVMPITEPKETMDTFLGELKRNCKGGFTGGVGKLDPLEGRTLGRAEATCGTEEVELSYDMVFYFTTEGALGITHVGLGSMVQKAHDINNGLIEMFSSW